MDVLSNIDFNNLLSYCIFPNSFIRNGNLSPQQKVLFEILCSYDHIDKDGCRKGWCTPSLDTVAEQMGLKKRAVQVHLKRLVEIGMVVIIYRNTEMNEGPRSSIYILNILPGLSVADRKRIAAARTIEIKHLISGLNSIKIQTVQGMQYTSKEEFDLEYLITGKRSSTVIEGEILDAEEIISSSEERRLREEDLYKFTAKCDFSTGNESCDTTGEDQVISFGPSSKRIKSNDRTGFNSEEETTRIASGNYKGVDGKSLCKYFKYLFEAQYPGELYLINTMQEPNIMRARVAQYTLDVFVPMIEFFIQRYDKLFANQEYPRPRIYHLSIPWILNKINEQYIRQEKAKEEMTTSTPSGEARMF